MAAVDHGNEFSTPEKRPWLIDERCDRYETEWRALRAPRIEDYLDGVEGEARTALWLELVMLDQELRRGKGEETTLADYQKACPDGMILLDASTARMDPITDVRPAVGAVIDAAAADPEGTLERPAAIFDPFQSTVAADDDDTGSSRPPGSDEPPTEAAVAAGRVEVALPSSGFNLGDYVLLEKLGAGGMGVVFKARQKGLKREVALKVIKAGSLADEKLIRLFRSEAEAVAALDHPNIVPVLDSGEHEGTLYYAMKLVDGQDLSRSLDHYRNNPAAIARLVARVAEAIAHAHQRGVLHRDLKPSNILIDETGEPHVIDFGLAKRLDTAVVETTTGNPVGTPGYMSPEQARGSRAGVTTATDVYGLGTLLYALLTGRPPFSGNSAVEVLRLVLDREPPRPRDVQPDVDRDLEIICLKCLSKEARDRYPSAGELADDLSRWLDGRPILARPASRVERAVKWVRRRKLIASLAAATVIGAIVGVAGLSVGWAAAVAARDEAREGEDNALHYAYAANMNLAERDWRDANVEQVLRHLDETRPKPGKSDLRGFEWYYLDRLCRSQGRPLLGHNGPVYGVAYSRNGRSIASAGADHTVRFWDAGTGQLIRTMESDNPVNAVAISPDGSRLASGGKGRELTLWDSATGQIIRKSEGHADRIYQLDFSPDGKTIASSSNDGTVRLWNGSDGSPIRELKDHRANNFGGLAFSPDSKTLASAGGGEPTVRMWEVATGRLVSTIVDDVIRAGASFAGQRQTSAGFIKPVVYSPDGKILATGGDDGTIRFRDAATGRLVMTLRDPHSLNPVTRLAFSPDGKLLASSNYFGQAASIWDVATSYLLRTIKVHTIDIPDVAFAADSVHLAAGCQNGKIVILDATRDQEARSLPANHSALGVAFGHDGTFVATALSDRTVTIQDVATGQVVRTLRGHTDKVRTVAVSKDGRHAASAGDDRTVRIWDVATGKEIHTFGGHTAPVFGVAFSPDGKLVASASDDRTVKVWDAEAGRELKTLIGHAFEVNAVVFSPDGKTVISGDNDGQVMVWNVETGRRIRAIASHPRGIHAIALSPDGRWLANVGYDEAVRIHDVATGQEIRKLTGHGMGIHTVAFSLDGKRLASGSADRTVRIWDPIFGQEVLVLRGHASTVTAVAFAPDGSRLASAGTDQTVRIWEAERPREGLTLAAPRK